MRKQQRPALADVPRWRRVRSCRACVLTYLDGVAYGVAEQEEGGGVMEALQPEQTEGVLERRQPPPLHREVVLEERLHLRVLHRAENNSVHAVAFCGYQERSHGTAT